MVRATAAIADFPEVSMGALPSGVEELFPLYEATQAAIEAVRGVFNKPRTVGLAASLLEDEMERLNTVAIAIGSKLAQVSSVPEFWRELYLEARLEHSFFSGGDANDALAVIAHANALPTVERNEKH